jgi:hypothetical protein
VLVVEEGGVVGQLVGVDPAGQDRDLGLSVRGGNAHAGDVSFI